MAVLLAEAVFMCETFPFPSLFLRILIRQNSGVFRKSRNSGMAEPVYIYIYGFGDLNGRFEICRDRTGTLFGVLKPIQGWFVISLAGMVAPKTWDMV